MKKMLILLFLLTCTGLLAGCADVAQQVETIAAQIDVEAIVTQAIEAIDWDELKAALESGYDTLTEKYPALKAENVKKFIKTNGLDLMNRLLSSADEAQQENARKLGEIIKILYPELTDEVDQVIG